MKAYTDIEQSEKLAEILPINTADCCYIKYCTSDNDEWRYEGQPPMFLGEIPITEITAEHIPSWSLVALLGVLPKNIGRYTKSLYWFDDAWHCGYEDEDAEGLYGASADEPIDACVAMVQILREKKIINFNNKED